jgi:hypothetical protein
MLPGLADDTTKKSKMATVVEWDKGCFKLNTLCESSPKSFLQKWTVKYTSQVITTYVSYP